MMSGWAAENGLDGATYKELVNTPAVREMVDEYMVKLNAELNRWETVKKWTLLDHDLSIERGELTPSLKVKRSVVAEQNKQVLEMCIRDSPEDAVIKLGVGHRYEFDYDKCTGCAVCVDQCPVHAIDMFPEPK